MGRMREEEEEEEEEEEGSGNSSRLSEPVPWHARTHAPPPKREPIDQEGVSER